MAFGSGLDDNEEMMSEINMTPLVDVMLVLLIIFILAMPVITHSVKIDLPKASHEVSEAKPETITLTIAEAGIIHWNNDIISETELETRLQTASQQQPQPAVHLRGDRQVDYEHVVKVMTAVQQAGLYKLGFLTEPGAK